MLGLCIAKNLDNKTLYLKRLKLELNKIANDAQPLEEIEKRLKIISGRSRKELSSLDLLSDLYRLLPAQLSLVNFNYEEDKQVILKGEAPELNLVFALIADLEKAEAFKSFDIKVRYATERNTAAGKVIDFEVLCVKK